jgi:succinoglycan biosynthesis transport protein ExoP
MNAQNKHNLNGHGPHAGLAPRHAERGPATAGTSSQDPFAFGDTIDIQQIINLLLVIKERWLWGLTAGILLAGLFAFVTLRKEPVYAADAYLLIEAKAEQVIDFEQVVDTSLTGRGEDELDNHLRQLQSRTFRKDVIKALDSTETKNILRPYLPEDPKDLPPSIEGILRNAVAIDRDGQIFSITVEHRDPEVAALVANRYAAQYITSILTRSGVGNESAMAFLEQQAEGLRDKISASEKELTDYRTRYNLVSLEENQNIIVERLKAINSQLTSARMEQLQLESSVEQVTEASGTSSGASAKEDGFSEVDLTELPVIAAYGSIPEILSRKKALEAERSELDLRYLEAHPRMIEAEKRLAQVAGQLQAEVSRAVRDLANQKDAVDRRIQHLDTELQKAESAALALDQQAVEYNVLKRQLDSDRQTFDQIIDRLNETNLSAKLDTTNLRILDEAVVPGKPVDPNPKKVALASAFLLMLGIGGIPLLVEAIDNRLKSAYDVETFIGKPLLADLPHLKGLESGEVLPTAVLDDSDEMLTEGFRSAYSSLQLHSSADMPKVILVTSTRPSEGKSFFASNLAACMAKHGLRCLLVDTDLRRPTLHRHFDLRNDKGLIRWYENQSQAQAQSQSQAQSLLDDPDLAIQTIAEDFHFLRAGGSTKKTTELIDSVAFERLMSGLKQSYDVIILDTPPVSVFTDSLFLAEFADEVVYVARYNEVSRQKARHFIRKLDGNAIRSGGSGKVVGMVINGRNSAKGQRYGYDYTYSYYSSDYKYYKRYAEESEPRTQKRTRSRNSVADPAQPHT